MNPSTEAILREVNHTPSEIVFVLPNNKNIVMAAQQCVGLTEKQVIVVPTHSIPQGISAMMSVDTAEEDLRSDMEEIGGRVWYCHYWEEHYSMVELTEDRNGKFNVDYVLDDAVTPEVRRDAALLAQKEFADCMQEWGISLLNAPVPEQMKYASLAEAASHLMQVLNDPESITG